MQHRKPAAAQAPTCGRRAAARLRARAELLSALVAFAVVLAGAAAVLEWVVPEVVDPNYFIRVQYLRRSQAAGPGPRRLVVALGSSLTYHGLDAASLDEPLSQALGEPVTVLNMALPNHLYSTQLLMWRRLQRDGVRPDLLLVEVLPALLIGDHPLQVDELRMPANRLCWSEFKVVEPYRGSLRPEMSREVALSIAGSLYTRRFAVAQALAPDLVPCADDNNSPLVWKVDWQPPTPPPEVRARLLEGAHRFCAPLLAGFQPGRCEIVRQLLASAKATGVTTALVVMPDGPALHSWYPPEVWSRIQAWLDAMVAEYGVEVINARDWFGREEDFYDSHHMLPPAAERFTERLGREHLLPLLRRQCREWPGTRYEDLHACE
jgi:hypothetical protein